MCSVCSNDFQANHAGKTTIGLTAGFRYSDAAFFGEYNEVTYAVDEDGKYVPTKSKGWDPKIVANSQYWKMVQEDVTEAVERIRDGKASVLYYFMILHQMDPGLLSDYSGFSRWRVKRHLKPGPFAKLKPELLGAYAKAFKIAVEDLAKLPDDAESPECIVKWAKLRE